MANTLKWFSRPADEPADLRTAAADMASEAEDDVQDHSVLPAHVQEFLALKTAAGF